jgi:hypothetical protein
MNDSNESRQALKLIGEYVNEHSATISNALGNQGRRMAEAADLAEAEGQPHFAKAFREDSDTSNKVLTELSDLLERLAEAQQEDYASQG